MTLFTYMTYAFVFVFLNTMHPSEGGCLDHLTNLTNVNLKEGFGLVIENRTVQMNCTLQRECKRGNGTGKACELLRDCFDLTIESKILPECSKEDPVKVHFSHIMCLISGEFDSVSRACNYENVSKILNVRKQCAGSNLTTTPAPPPPPVSGLTTQTKTAVAAPVPPPTAVSDPTTTQTTTTTTTTTVAPTTMKSKATAPAPSPNATSLDPDVSDPTTTQTTTTTVSEITTTATPTTGMLSTSEAAAAAQSPNATFPDPNVFDSTTTQTTTTVSEITTTAATPTTGILSTSEAAAPAQSPKATFPDSNVSDPTTTQTTTTVSEITTATATAAATPTTGILSTSEAVAAAQSPNATFQDPNVNLQRLLWLSMVFHVIVPVAVYLYVRRQWRRDKASYMSNGNSTEDKQNTEVALMLDAPITFVKSNEQTSGLFQTDGYSDDEDESELSGRPTRL